MATLGPSALPLPPPRNEPQRSYAPGTPERASLRAALHDMAATAPHDLPMVIGGRPVHGNGTSIEVRAPHDHALLLGTMPQSTPADVAGAVEAAMAAWASWSRTSFETRAAVFLRAAELLAGPWRDRLNAATMLGQSKTVYQAEIDSACELIDFWRWNVHFAADLWQEQPVSPPGVWNRTELRPLEGFVVAITPFNFTSIAGNLPTAPAIMGNVVVWKPAPTAQLAASVIMDLLAEAGLPPGVVNMVTGHGAGALDVALGDRRLAGVHFTGSTPTFHALWRQVGANLDNYRTYPRLVGETGGKDFVIAHASASPDELLVGLLRGAFEYQGQKCSAASRAYVPAPLWQRMRGALAGAVDSLPMGDVTDFSNFLGAVIDDRAFRKHDEALAAARNDPHLRVLAGGETDSSVGWFVRPTILETGDPKHDLMQRELFGPILTVYPYPEGAWEDTLRLVDETSPYALTGAVFAHDRAAVEQATARLRDAAGNFYVNDKPTGAVVGQQPFGGARASGTNDKAGSSANLGRWTSLRAIKENLLPPTDWPYPHMQPD